jgi:hypothetical protein
MRGAGRGGAEIKSVSDNECEERWEESSSIE